MQGHSACYLSVFTKLFYANINADIIINQQYSHMRGIINHFLGNAIPLLLATQLTVGRQVMSFSIIKKPFQIPKHFSISPSCKCASSRQNFKCSDATLAWRGERVKETEKKRIENRRVGVVRKRGKMGGTG